MGDRLYEDVHSAEIVVEHSSDLVRSDGESREVDAIERGHRTHPSGVTEDYERIEFR